MIIYSVLCVMLSILQMPTHLIHTVIISGWNFNLGLLDIRGRSPIVESQINQRKEAFFFF